MPAIYRYGRKAHIQELVSRGRLMIGTLHDFRRAELDEGISDPQEGKKTVHHRTDFTAGPFDPFSADRPAELREMEAFGTRLFAKDPDTIAHVHVGRLVVENFQMERNFEAPDCYVLCASSELSRATMAACSQSYDACAQIIELEPFFHAITAALSKLRPVRPEGIALVNYTARRHTWNRRDWGQHPVFMKEPNYGAQREVRAVWEPLTPEPIKPALIEDRRIARYCREVRPL